MDWGAKIQGDIELKKKLKEMTPIMRRVLWETLKLTAIKMHRDAVKKIRDKQSRGNLYMRGRKTHIASEEGFPPNWDTGRLGNSIAWELKARELKAIIGTDVDYGYFLEFGTRKMGARPWLGPTMKENEDTAEKILEKVFDKEIKRILK